MQIHRIGIRILAIEAQRTGLDSIHFIFIPHRFVFYKLKMFLRSHI